MTYNYPPYNVNRIRIIEIRFIFIRARRRRPSCRACALPPCLIPKQALVFIYLQSMALENTVGKGNEQFFHFPQCFLSVLRTFHIFIIFEIVVCKLFKFGRV